LHLYYKIALSHVTSPLVDRSRWTVVTAATRQWS